MKKRKMFILSVLSVVLVFSLIFPACSPGNDEVTDSVVDGSGALDAMLLDTPARNITPMIAVGEFHVVGLKSDGTVVAVGDDRGCCDVGCWIDIIQSLHSGATQWGLRLTVQ